MTTKIIAIEGMNCRRCAGAVNRALSALDGVTCLQVNLDQKYAEVELERNVPDDALIAAVKTAGYEPVSVEEQMNGAEKNINTQITGDR